MEPGELDETGMPYGKIYVIDTVIVTPGDHTSGGERAKSDTGIRAGEGLAVPAIAAMRDTTVTVIGEPLTFVAL